MKFTTYSFGILLICLIAATIFFPTSVDAGKKKKKKMLAAFLLGAAVGKAKMPKFIPVPLPIPIKSG